MEDRQLSPPVDWCPWCGGEIYGGEEVWVLDGACVHEDCLGEYARAHCERRILEERKKGWRYGS